MCIHIDVSVALVYAAITSHICGTMNGKRMREAKCAASARATILVILSALINRLRFSTITAT